MRWREDIVRFRAVSIPLLLSVFFILGAWMWASAALRGVSGPLVLHWNSSEGINEIGTLTNLSAIAFAGLVMVAVNGAIALALESRDWFWGKLVAASTLLMSVLLFIAFAAIISVN